MMQSRFVQIAALLVFAVTMILRPAEAAGPESISLEEFDRRMAEVSNAGGWGSDDALETLDLIPPEVRQATARGRHTFMFVEAPLPVIGGVGSPLSPLVAF